MEHLGQLEKSNPDSSKKGEIVIVVDQKLAGGNIIVLDGATGP